MPEMGAGADMSYGEKAVEHRLVFFQRAGRTARGRHGWLRGVNSADAGFSLGTLAKLARLATLDVG